MEVIATNIGSEVTVEWKGKTIQTGIYKYPVAGPIVLGDQDVVSDRVVDRIHHGGLDKACYCYSADHYTEWKRTYEQLDWKYGMFGENLTIEGLQERNVKIGDCYAVGTAIVQVTQPRQPCYKLGIRFGTQVVLKRFIAALQPGCYMAVKQGGKVRKGDRLELIDRLGNAVSVADAFRLMYHTEKEDHALADLALNSPVLPEDCKKMIRFQLAK
jgi:MOSC domain-containing protein YiiM